MISTYKALKIWNNLLEASISVSADSSLIMCYLSLRDLVQIICCTKSVSVNSKKPKQNECISYGMWIEVPTNTWEMAKRIEPFAFHFIAGVKMNIAFSYLNNDVEKS